MDVYEVDEYMYIHKHDRLFGRRARTDYAGTVQISHLPNPGQLQNDLFRPTPQCGLRMKWFENTLLALG